MQFRKSTAVGVALTLGGNFILNLASPDPVGSNCAWAKGVVSGKNTAAEKVSADATGEVPADGARLVPDRSHANLKVRRRAGKEPSHKSEEPPLVEKYLLEGRLAEGETALLTRLRKQGDDDQARFGLGVLQFLRAVEGLGQDFYRFGLRDYSSHGFVLPFLRLPVPANSEPQLMTYRDAREIAERLN